MQSSILDWEISWAEEPGGLQFMGSQRLDMIEHIHIQTHNYSEEKYPLNLALLTENSALP